jgi:ribosomal protein S12 methylthiotransferase accessory factor YcaO
MHLYFTCLLLDGRWKANIQAGFSAGWSAKPEKTVPIAKSILEIRQALNVSHSIYSASIFVDDQGEEEEHEERRKERQREIMWSKSKHGRELTKRINGIISGSCLKLPQYLLNRKNRRIYWRKVF